MVVPVVVRGAHLRTRAAVEHTGCNEAEASNVYVDLPGFGLHRLILAFIRAALCHAPDIGRSRAAAT